MNPTTEQLEALGRQVFVETGNGHPPFTIAVHREPFDLPKGWLILTITDANKRVQFHGGIGPDGRVST